MERVRSSRPGDESWRADALAGSRHSRWIDELRQPLSDHDPGRAAAICGQVTRLALQDFAPALLVLPSFERRRLQTVTAYALTLLDFARQTGLEGERLTAINRWEFELEDALEGNPTGQPVFVLVHELEQVRPWPRAAFDRLHSYARRRTAQTRPTDRAIADRDTNQLASSLAWLVLDQEPTAEVLRFCAALLRLRGLLDLGDDLRRHRARLPTSELPDSWIADSDSARAQLAGVIGAECDQLLSDLDEPKLAGRFAIDLRPAARYCQHTAKVLLKGIRAAGFSILETPPRVGLLRRLRLLIRSKWF